MYFPYFSIYLCIGKRVSMSMTSSSLIVVSNRLPFTLGVSPEDGSLRRKPAAGGLVTAVAPVVIQSKGVWVGWPGSGVDKDAVIPESDPSDTSPTAGLLSSQVVPVHLTDEVRTYES